MKNKFTLSGYLFIVLFAFLSLNAEAQNVPELIYYKFDGTGTSVTNSASTPVGNNPATISGTLTQGGTGQFGGGLQGTGASSSTDVINSGWNTSLTGSWTISLYLNNIPSSSTLFYYFGDAGASSFRCFTNGVAGANNLMLRGPLTDVIIVGGATVGVANVCHFVYDATVPEIRGYYNGVLAVTVPQAAISLTGTGFQVGGYATNSGLSGTMDEFRLYDRALTATEISSTWNQSLPLLVGANDAGIQNIVSPSSPAIVGSQPVSINIFNYGSATLTSATINWEVNGIAGTPFNYSGSLASLTSDGPILLGNATLINGNNTVKAWTSNPNGTTDANNANDTLEITVFACPAISGTYTINSALLTGGTNFQSFTDAVSAISQCGITGAVTFDVVTGSGPYNEQISIPEITGASSVNTITFNGNGETIAFSSSSSNDRAVIRLDGADFITINNLVVNANGPGIYGWGIHLTNAADNNTISNNTVLTDVISTSSTNYGGIIASGTLTSMTTTGNSANNTTIINNSITGGYYGIAISGTSTTVKSSGNQILNNTITEHYLYGMRVYYQDAPIITGNDVTQRIASTSGYGIYTFNVDGATQILGNRLDGWGTYGIYMSSFNSSAVSRPTVANNMISSNPSITGTSYGIYMVTAREVDLWHNSVNVGGTARALYISSSTSTNADIRNNSFAYSGGSTGYAMYVSSTLSILACDYNNYYSNGSNFVFYGAAKADLATLQATNIPAGNDANSKQGDPEYFSSTNLHSISFQLNNSGTPIPAITVDFDGQTRNALTPDIGADEFTPPSTDAGPTALIQPVADGCVSSTSDVIVEVTNFGLDPIDFSLNPLTVTANITGPVNQVVSTTVNTGNLSPGATLNVNLGAGNFGLNGTYTFAISTAMPGDGIAVNNNLNVVVNKNTISVFPHMEDFESLPPGQIGQFSNGWFSTTTVNPRWESEDASGANENSSNTGPFYDHTTFGVSGGMYMFLETSGGSLGSESMLVSPCIDFTSNPAPAISFWYHMYGVSMGDLHLDVSSDGGNTWVLDVMPPIIGQQQTAGSDPWLQATALLDPFAGQQVLIRFRGVRGSNFESDMSIDDINIFQQPACDPLTLTAGTASPGNAQGCAGDAFDLLLSGHSSGLGLTIQWEESADNITFVPISGANTATYTTGSLTGGSYYYRAVVSCAPNSANSNVVSITIDDAQVLSATGDTICGFGNATLNATTDPGNSIIWYADSIGGNPLGTGNSFSAFVNSDTTFYVAAAAGGSPIVYAENFEGSGSVLPIGWTATGLWHTTNACVTGTPPNPSYWAYYGVDGACNFDIGTNSGDLTSPQIALPASSGIQLDFSYLYNGENGTPPSGFDNASILISVNGGAFTLLENITPVSTQNAWLQKTIDLTSYAGNTIQLRWNFSTQDGIGNTGTGLQLDEISIGTESCESLRVPVAVVATPAPAISLSATSSIICVGDNTTITVSSTNAGYSYTWSPGGQTGSSINVSPTSTTTYVVTADDGICAISDSILIDVLSLPVLSPTAEPTLICTGESSQLDAGTFISDTLSTPLDQNNGSSATGFDITNTSTVPVTLHYFSFQSSASSGTVGIQEIYYNTNPMNCVFPSNVTTAPGWVLIGSVSTTSNGPSPAAPTVIPLDVNITIPAGATYAFAVGGALSQSYTSGTSGCPVMASTPHISVQEGFGGTLTGTIANRRWNGSVTYDYGDSNLTFAWTPAGSLNNSTIKEPVATPGVTTIYTVTATNAGGCSSSASVTVNVADTPPTPVATSLVPDTLCVTGEVLLEMTGSIGAIQWQQSSDGINWNNIPGADSALYDGGTISQSTYYRVLTSCVNSSASNAIYYHVVNPQVISTQGNTRCGVGTVDLQATANPGESLTWFDAQTGGSQLGTGNLLTTPIIGTTTDFYVESSIGGAGSETVPLPAEVSGFTGNVRGHWFIAPVSFTITGLKVPGATTTQSIAVVRFNPAVPPPVFSGTTNDFVTLFLTQNNTNTGVIPVSISVNAGDVIGILGQRGTTTSYGPSGSYTTTISGVPVDLTRMGMQFSLTTTAPQDIWQEPTGALGLIEMTYSSGCSSPRVPVTATVTPAPVVNISSSALVSCGGAPVTLTASSANDPNYTYTWQPGGLSGAAVTVTPIETTTYIVHAIDNSTLCENYDTLELEVVAAPPLALTSSGTFFCDVANAVLSTGGGGSPTVQVGTGTSSSPTAAGPVYISTTGSTFKYSRHISIYTAAEIIAAGGTAGLINQLSWYKTNTAGYTAGDAQFDIYIKPVAFSTHASTPINWASEITGATLVYSSNTQNLNTSIGWQDFVFTTPFNWNGTDNLEIFVDWFRPSAPTASNPGWQYTSTTNANAITGATSVPSTVSRNSNRPNVMFGFAQSLVYAWSPAAGLSATTGATVTATPTATTTYSVVVTDNLTGCTSTDSVTIIVEPTPAPVITTSSPMPLCNGETTTLGSQYSSTNGFQFDWNGLFNTESITVAVAGNYTLLVTSPNGCTSNPTVYTVEVSTIFADIFSVTNVSCYGGSNGSVEISALGSVIDPSGTIYFGPFLYSANGGTPDSSNVLTGFSYGSHVVTVDDPSTGCSLNLPVFVSEPDELFVLTVVNNTVSCNGGSDGSATATATGGTGPYVFDWLTPIPKQGETNDDIPAGTWTVMATDANGCTATTELTMTEPDVLIADLGASMVIPWGTSNGYTASGCASIPVSVAGGTIPYSYQWSTGDTGNPLNICFSLDTTIIFTVTVTDANGCTATATVTYTWANIDCSNNSNGTKVKICFVPPGNPENCQTICIAVSAAAAIFSNTPSYLGQCQSSCPTSGRMAPSEIADKLTVTIFPNPTNGKVIVDYLSEQTIATSIVIMDIQGRELMNIPVENTLEFTREINLGNLENGMYIVNIFSDQILISSSRVIKAH